MKALTLHQPWAWAILHAGKNIENRSWPTYGFTGDLAIHAGKEVDLSAMTFLLKMGIKEWPRDLVLGAVIGVVTVTGGHNSAACVRTCHLAEFHPDGPYRCSPWAMGGATGNGPMIHWELANPRPCKPAPMRGFQRLWNLPDGFTPQLLETAG